MDISTVWIQSSCSKQKLKVKGVSVLLQIQAKDFGAALYKYYTTANMYLYYKHA